MNQQIFQKISNSHNELSHYLKQQFTYGNFDETYLNSFYNDVKKYIPHQSNVNSKELKNYYSFMESSKQLIGDAIGDNDLELFNKSLLQVLEETVYILKKY